ncbi:MAG TPA: hypothetical protein VL752_10500 [Acidisoma sp.]|nr:hypothetical protein [Acidisoma sp.]HTI01362.1 hypothetical protein [Acidisoma sp.]
MTDAAVATVGPRVRLTGRKIPARQGKRIDVDQKGPGGMLNIRGPRD